VDMAARLAQGVIDLMRRIFIAMIAGGFLLLSGIAASAKPDSGNGQQSQNGQQQTQAQQRVMIMLACDRRVSLSRGNSSDHR